MTKEEIIEAINELFGDTSVPASDTLSALIEIRDAAEMNIDALRADGVE